MGTTTKQAAYYIVVGKGRHGVVKREDTLGDAQAFAFRIGGRVVVVFTDGTMQEV